MLHVLNEADRVKMRQAYQLVWEITEAHSHNCGCILCEARAWLSGHDVSDYSVEADLDYEPYLTSPHS